MKCPLCNYENDKNAEVRFRCGNFLEKAKTDNKNKSNNDNNNLIKYFLGITALIIIVILIIYFIK